MTSRKLEFLTLKICLLVLMRDVVMKLLRHGMFRTEELL